MNILVVGCGNLGARLATRLDAEGHDVAVVDYSERAFNLLGDNFDGITVAGIPIDQDVLRSAGIENCDALAAVTQNDNMNIMVAQIAQNFFGISKVIARINDPDKEASFSRFGLTTICPTNLGAVTAYIALTEQDGAKTLAFDNSLVSFITIPTDHSTEGHKLSEIILDSVYCPFAIQHADGSLTLIKSSDPTITVGDKIIVARNDSAEQTERW